MSCGCSSGGGACGGQGSAGASNPAFTIPGTEQSEVMHHVDDKECPDGHVHICGPDVTDSLVDLMTKLTDQDKEWFSSSAISGAEFVSELPNGGNLDFKSDELFKKKIVSEECPKNCPPEGDEAEGTGIGCTTVCNICLESSVIANILLGYVTKYYNHITGGKAASWLSKSLSWKSGDKTEDSDQCAIQLGICMAEKTDRDEGFFWWKWDDAPTRSKLCECFAEYASCLDTCPCDPCPDEGEGGKKVPGKTGRLPVRIDWHDDPLFTDGASPPKLGQIELDPE